MAQIVKIELVMVDLVPKVKRTDAIQSFVSQETPIALVTDSDGQVGVGYSYTIGTGGPAVMSLLKDTLAPKLIGQEAENIERLWRDGLFETHATSVGAITSLALATLDTALWDLRAKRAGLPLYQLLGGAKASVPLYTTEGGWLHISEGELVRDALEMQTRGFAGAKVKIGKPSLAEDRARLRAMRSALGDDFLILVDANQSFSLSEAIRRADMLRELDVYWFEEPMPADDIGAHEVLARHSVVPIAVGESMYSVSQFKDYLQRGAVSVVQVDVARVGGITPWMKVAHMAEAFNVSVCPHFLMELHVSLVTAIPNAPLLEYIPQLDAITKSTMRIENGRAYPSEKPGLGIDWNFDEIKARAVPSLSAMIN